jgi:hypothetical protein
MRTEFPSGAGAEKATVGASKSKPTALSNGHEILFMFFSRNLVKDMSALLCLRKEQLTFYLCPHK